MASPFTHQLGTNYCPSDEEVLEIQRILVEPTLRMKRLDDEIAKLVAERDRLGAFVKAHNALISPIRRLPLDIVQEIFLACLPTHRNCVMSASEAPVLLGRICSSWRAISLSTPTLWASLHVIRPLHPPSHSPGFDSFERKCAQRLETIKAWLHRSGGCALSISLEDPSGYYGGRPAPDAATHPSILYLQALILFASRWRKIEFTSRAPMLMETLSSLTASDVPILRDVVIREYHGSVNPALPSKTWASIGILGAPALSMLSLSVGNLRPAELPARWGQITSLTLEDMRWASAMTGDETLQVLSQCPALRFCRLTVANVDDNFAGGCIVECPLLHNMHLSCNSDTIERLFPCLSLPGLRQFGLCRSSAPESDNVLSFPSFFAVATQLETLTISSGTPSNTLSKAYLETLLRGLPTIQRLEIQFETDAWIPQGVELVEDDTLEFLIPSHDDPSPCCPALRELVLHQCILVSDAALLHLINARMAVDSCSPLKRVKASFARERRVDIVPDLRQYMDSGFHVSLQYFSARPSGFSPWLGLNPITEDVRHTNYPNSHYGF
ncbi:hypothetical protein DFH06DRAFT_692477 [Mycena polygramma]|nr:hypothetical protein DFH06DRAFT_692477 [Mycena polygramma]